MMSTLDTTSRRNRVVLRSLLTRIAALILIFTIAVYVAIFVRTQDLVMQTVEEQATSYANLIVKARTWNARHGGVFVEKLPGVEDNPYLAELGVDPDIVCEDGTVLTMRNPAMMTNEIAELLARDSGMTFHLTSLDPINPDSLPDSWERQRLEEFEGGAREAGEIVEHEDGSAVYRYMIPLDVESSCLPCHAEQGYETGEVRGALSITIPIDHVKSELRRNGWNLAGIAAVTLAGVLGLGYVMSSRVIEKLEETERQLEHLAVTDSLTDLWNRRHMMKRLKEEFERSRRQGHGLGLIMLDLDHFKHVNDQFGHGFGDLVLTETAERMHSVIRDYDILGRFGGEEFLVIVPETEPQDVTNLAERIRQAVSADPVAGSGSEITVTTSAGVAMLSKSDLAPDALLARADAALYIAKRLGRDRVVLGETPEDRDPA